MCKRKIFMLQTPATLLLLLAGCGGEESTSARFMKPICPCQEGVF